MSWKPKPRADCDFGGLQLDDQAAFVLVHVDGAASVADLSQATGLPEGEVRQILGGLVSQGAIEAERRDAPPPAQAVGARSKLPSLGDPPPSVSPSQPEEPLQAAAEQEPETGDVATHRKLFETELHQLDEAVRIHLAAKASDPILSAFCFDPNPKVIRAVLENLKTGMAQARLIAEHHRSGVGLEALGRRSQFLRDNMVRRMLFRNPQTSDPLFRRLLESLPLIQIFKSTLGRESTDRAKRNAREIMRQKFQRVSAEERVSLIFNTEGRCLTQLVGLNFDQKTTALLCGRPYNSTMLVQNLARFSATPPNLIAHLLRQNLVRRSQHLSKLLKRHSNCPSSLKG